MAWHLELGQPTHGDWKKSLALNSNIWRSPQSTTAETSWNSDKVADSSLNDENRIYSYKTSSQKYIQCSDI